MPAPSVEVAVMVAVPSVRAVIVPFSVTLTISGLLLFQANSGYVAFAGLTLADKVLLPWMLSVTEDSLSSTLVTLTNDATVNFALSMFLCAPQNEPVPSYVVSFSDLSVTIRKSMYQIPCGVELVTSSVDLKRPVVPSYSKWKYDHFPAGVLYVARMDDTCS